MKRIYLILLLIFFLLSCKKNKIEDEYYIKGLVHIVPEFSYWYSESEIGEDVTVLLENSDLITTTEKGKFIFSDIDNREYNLHFSKNRYSDLKTFDYQPKKKFGDTLFDDSYNIDSEFFYLFEKSTTTFESDLTFNIENDQVTFWATVNRPLTTSSADSIRYFFVFIDETDQVSFEKYKFCASGVPIVYGKEVFQRINVAEFDYNKTYYAVAYGATANRGYGDGKAKYFDIDKDVWIYMGLNDTPSNIVSFSINSK